MKKNPKIAKAEQKEAMMMTTHRLRITQKWSVTREKKQ